MAVARASRSDAADDDEERRLCAFAPAKHLLDKQYTGAALDFSGSPANDRASALNRAISGGWAAEIPAEDHGRQTAALRYIIEGRQGRELGEEIRRNRPGWLPWPRRSCGSARCCLAGPRRKRTISCTLFRAVTLLTANACSAAAARTCNVLAAIHAWWRAEGSGYVPHTRREPTQGISRRRSFASYRIARHGSRCSPWHASSRSAGRRMGSISVY